MQDIETDVAVIGAGIAGVSTAFFTLKYTDKNVTLLEGYKLAHGATGHNAGQITSYFERGFASIAEEFGLQMAAEGQTAIEGAWELLDEMYTDAGLMIPFSRFEGYAGLVTFDQVIFHLKNNLARKNAGIVTERFRIADDAPFLTDIPVEYREIFEVVSRQDILDPLETEDTDFVATISFQKGGINSALFCEEVVLYLLKKYPDRFRFYEHTPINKVIVHDDSVVLDAETHEVQALQAVLCTNGFEGFHLITSEGLAIDTKFHHLVEGVVGYMSGYLEHMNKPSTAISYFTENKSVSDDLYYYLTRRPYDYDGKKKYNLISIGGPEIVLDDRMAYSREAEYPDEMAEDIDRFVKKVYDTDPNRKIDYLFTWHGLMGYTKSLIRLIGPEPDHPALLYNLGCNGVGILPSVFGGRRIAEYIAGQPVAPSIFDIPRS